MIRCKEKPDDSYWNKWYAWHPVWITSYSNKREKTCMVWFDYCEIKFSYGWGERLPKYRLLRGKP